MSAVAALSLPQAFLFHKQWVILYIYSCCYSYSWFRRWLRTGAGGQMYRGWMMYRGCSLWWGRWELVQVPTLPKIPNVIVFPSFILWNESSPLVLDLSFLRFLFFLFFAREDVSCRLTSDLLKTLQALIFFYFLYLMSSFFTVCCTPKSFGKEQVSFFLRLLTFSIIPL